MREAQDGASGIGEPMVLRALVAVEHPVPVDIVSCLGFDQDGDLTALLSRLELDGSIEWLDDGTIVATGDALASTSLTRSERATLRGAVGRAALPSAMPPGLVARWLLDGCRVLPDATVVPSLLNRADRAIRMGDLAAAVDVLESVVAAIERGQPVPPPERVRAYLRLGYALRWLCRWDDAGAVAVRALEAARSSGDPAALAVAAIAWRPDAIAVSDDPSVVALVDEALATVEPGAVMLRSRLLAARAEALLFTDLSAAQAAATEALELGRQARDHETFLTAGFAHRITHWHPSRQAETLALANEMVAVSQGVVDYAEYGALVRLQVFLETGDWAHVDNELAAMGRRVRDAPRPFEQLWLQIAQVARAQTRGHWDEASQLIDRSLDSVSGPEHGSAFQLLLTQRVLNTWHTSGDLLAFVGLDVLPAGPMRVSWEACLLGWTCEQRDAVEVSSRLEELLADGIDSVRPDLTFGPVTSSLAMAAASVGSVRHAGMLFDGLLPYAEQWAGTGGAVVNGPYALHLGSLASVLGRRDEARRLFDLAERSATDGGCTPWLARTHLARARATSDRKERRYHAGAAHTLAGSIGMGAVDAAARSLLGLEALPYGLTDREAEVLRLLADGATNAEMAQRMFLSVKTVERHLLNAYRKANLRNRAEATAFALRDLS